MKFHIKIYLLVCIAALLLTGCDTVFDVHPYDVRVKGETDLNAKNIQKIEQTVKSKDTIRFAVISDSHQWLDDLVDAVNDINRRQDSIDFVIPLRRHLRLRRYTRNEVDTRKNAETQDAFGSAAGQPRLSGHGQPDL